MARTGFAGSSSTAPGLITLLAGIACIALIIVPGSAATKYMGGAPSFSATVIGVNEFSPGEDATVSILVENDGLFDVKQLNKGTIQPDDLPTTAKMVTIGLTSGSDLLVVKTDPQMVGDIPGSGNTVTVRYAVKISSNATAGEYTMPLNLRYRYPLVFDQDAMDVFQFTYNKAEDTLPVIIRVKPKVKIEVISAVPEKLTSGSEGWVDLRIRNTGPENGEMASVTLLRNGQSPIIPIDNTVFVGDFPSGATVNCRYKISILKDTPNQSYPVDVVVTSRDREGRIVTSSPETVGVPVMGKISFEAIPPPATIPPGTEKTIEVQYRNDGGVTVYDAQALVQAHAPVSIPDNTAFLGDLEPGATATARYKIVADKSAEPMTYSFDSKVRYRDATGNSQESDPLPVQITVTKSQSGFSSVPGGLPVLVLCIAAGIVAASFVIYYIYKRNRRAPV
ncbi:MAG TPA: S-layer protein [Methanoregulaceae archaeon]|nr:S-layer protein [Methanoregulaceae archaeon]